ncbi:MAG: GTPase HflX [Actinobacteria bacterium]|nr:GTPase HflX [Actinomycetota bacterium]
MKATDGGEKAVLVAVQLPEMNDSEASESLKELKALAQTAGASVNAQVIQKRKYFNPATVIGRGKLQELHDAMNRTGSELIIFDNELTVTQLERLQNELKSKVMDRTALILDIFAQHALTREGKTQVELAQLSYLLPRIRGKGIELSRMGGGIGTRRGPGETKLEVDRRRIRKRMKKLEDDLAHMEAVRLTQRKGRTRAGLFSICLVGYTNSGKSTLLNRLSNADVLVQDMLFSTLDSTTRRVKMPGGKTVLLSDTVGFIKKLPHELIAAFHSTLEVVREADLILHVIETEDLDIVTDRIRSVDSVLEELQSSDISQIKVITKADVSDPGDQQRLRNSFPEACFVSARSGEGIDSLLKLISGEMPGSASHTFLIPVKDVAAIAEIQSIGYVSESKFIDNLVEIKASIPPESLKDYAKYLKNVNNTS